MKRRSPAVGCRSAIICMQSSFTSTSSWLTRASSSMTERARSESRRVRLSMLFAVIISALALISRMRRRSSRSSLSYSELVWVFPLVRANAVLLAAPSRTCR